MLRIFCLVLTLSLVAILAACSSGAVEGESLVGDRAQPDKSRMTRLLKDVRMQNRLPGLRRSARLDAAARAHADDMARNGFFSHKSPTAGRVGDRVAARGYDWCFVAENIAFGQRSEAEVLETWLQSPGHRKNIMSRRAGEFGFASVNQAQASRKPLWVMVFARRGC